MADPDLQRVIVSVRRGFSLEITCDFASWMTHQAAATVARELSVAMGVEVVLRRAVVEQGGDDVPRGT